MTCRIRRRNRRSSSGLGSFFVVEKARKTASQLTSCSARPIAAKIAGREEILEDCLPAKSQDDPLRRSDVRRRRRFFLCENQMTVRALTGCWRPNGSYCSQYHFRVGPGYALSRFAHLKLQRNVFTFRMLNVVLLFQKVEFLFFRWVHQCG